MVVVEAALDQQGIVPFTSYNYHCLFPYLSFRVPIGLETIAEASASTVTKGNSTTRGGHHMLSSLDGLSATNGAILRGRSSGDLAARGRRHTLSPLPTRSSRDSTM